ncbi:MAG: hypothetical protein FWF59_15425 [Turicibacter sp.]|nr:hypothetical protein [Turicibacter sp.]
MRHYSHIAQGRMKQPTSGMPMEFECSDTLDSDPKKELHAVIGGGAFTKRLAEISLGLLAGEHEN